MNPKADPAPTPFDQKLFLVFITTFAAMTAFEFAGQFLYPYPPDWRSNLVTSFFVSGLAIIVAYFPLKSYYDTHVRVLSEMERRRSVETALKGSESYLGSIIRVSPVGIAAGTGRVLGTVNDRFCAITGYTSGELIGTSVRILYPAQEEYDRVGTEARAQFATNRSAELKSVWKKKDGSLIDVLLSATRVDPSDPSSEITFTVLDITEQERAEKELRESENKFRNVVENSLDGILITAMDGTVLFRNRAEAAIFELGSETARLGTSNVFEYVSPEVRGKILEDFSRVAQGIDSYPVTYPALTATRRPIWVEAIGKRIRFQDSPAVLVSLRDISARKQMEETLQRANRKLNLLSTITRHDINNKLHALNGYIELVHANVAADPPLQEYFSRITDASDQIATMIQFTKEYKDIGIRASVWQELRSLVDEAGRDALPGRVSIRNELPSGAEIFADPLIVKVFFNLIDNAQRHGGKITTIRFSFSASDHAGTIVCEDDGDGVVLTDKERIFDRGFGKNTGFGLAISREILDITGITIRETGEPGKGARFEMTVPREAYRITDAGKTQAGRT
ncbi:MAG TPA: PAS domain S-box protein [Methanoregula sp.]|nr:PAS domain S-box protein [Methanoregula sp.]